MKTAADLTGELFDVAMKERKERLALAKQLAEAQAERNSQTTQVNNLRAELLRVAVAAGVFYETDGSGPVRAPTDAVVREIEMLVKDRAASDRLRHVKDDLLRIASKVGITYLADYTEEVPGPTDSIIHAIVAIQTREHEARRSLDAAQDKCNRFMRGMQAMLVAAGASEDIDTQERQCNEAGPKPSDFVRKAFAELRGKLGEAWIDARSARTEHRASLERVEEDIARRVDRLGDVPIGCVTNAIHHELARLQPAPAPVKGQPHERDCPEPNDDSHVTCPEPLPCATKLFLHGLPIPCALYEGHEGGHVAKFIDVNGTPQQLSVPLDPVTPPADAPARPSVELLRMHRGDIHEAWLQDSNGSEAVDQMQRAVRLLLDDAIAARTAGGK